MVWAIPYRLWLMCWFEIETDYISRAKQAGIKKLTEVSLSGSQGLLGRIGDHFIRKV